MCTESNTSANVNIEIATIQSIIGQQIGMIEQMGAQPEAIYLEKSCYDKLTGDLIEQLVKNSGLAGISTEDISVKKYRGIAINRMDDVRNMNHHTYFQGWGLPIQVTIKPNTYPQPEVEVAPEAEVEEFEFDGTLGSLPQGLREMAKGYFDRAFFEDADTTRKVMDSDFDLHKVSLKAAFDWDDTPQGHNYWSNINSSKDYAQKAELNLKS